MADYSHNLEKMKENCRIYNELLANTVEMKQEIDERLVISSLDDVSYYDSIYSRLRYDFSNEEFCRRQMYDYYFLYQDMIEGGM